MSALNLIILFLYDLITMIFLIILDIYYVLESIIKNYLIPKHMVYKNIEDNVVLITGAG